MCGVALRFVAWNHPSPAFAGAPLQGSQSLTLGLRWLPLEGSWTRRGLRGGSTGSAPKFMVQIPHRRPEGSAPAGAFRRPTGATPRLLGRRWPPYRVIVRKRRMIYTPVRGTSRTPSTTKIREKVGTKFAGEVSHSTGGVKCPHPTSNSSFLIPNFAFAQTPPS